MKYINGALYGGYIVVRNDVLIDTKLDYFDKIVFGEINTLYGVNEINEDASLKIAEKYKEPIAKVNKSINKLIIGGYVYER